jgi:hypothetical protein
MSDELFWLALGIGLVLASYSLGVLFGVWPHRTENDVRVFVTGDERARRGLLVVTVAALGVSLAGWLSGWESWPAGLVFGLAGVEAGPAGFGWLKRRFRKGD